MRTHENLLTESMSILIRRKTGSASTRMATIAILCSVILHGGVLTACICFSRDAFRLANVRQGAAANENRIMLLASTADRVLPTEFAIQPIGIGASDVDRAAEELAVHRGIERVRRVEDAVTIPFLESPQAEFVVSTSDLAPLRKRAETLDDIKPRSMRMMRRPRRHAQQLSAPVSPPTALQAGSESWVPDPVASNEPPVYPADAMNRRAEGTAYLRVTVTREGEVIRTEVKQSSGWPALDQAATDAVSKWRFQPQVSRFASTTQTVVIPIEFVLNR